MKFLEKNIIYTYIELKTNEVNTGIEVICLY